MIPLPSDSRRRLGWLQRLRSHARTIRLNSCGNSAKRTKDADAARRMLALALVLEGKSRTEAATSCGMDRQILCDWVHRYNAQGIEGLHNRTAPGAKPKLSAEQE